MSAGPPVRLKQGKCLSLSCALVIKGVCSPSKEDHALSTHSVSRTVRRRLRCVLQNVPVHTVALLTTILNCLSGYSRVSVKNSVEWMSCSSVHVMRAVNAQLVQVEFMSTMSWLPHPSLHSVKQCTCPKWSSLFSVLVVLGSLSILRILVPRALSKNCVVKLV